MLEIEGNKPCANCKEHQMTQNRKKDGQNELEQVGMWEMHTVHCPTQSTAKMRLKLALQVARCNFEQLQPAKTCFLPLLHLAGEKRHVRSEFHRKRQGFRK